MRTITYSALILLAALLLASVQSLDHPAGASASHPCSGPPFIFGDATDEDRVDFADVEINLRTLVDPEQPFTHSACGAFDVDCDDDIDGLDALTLLAYMADLPYSQEPGCPDIGSGTGG